MPNTTPGSPTPPVILDRENPWPGLATFDEESHNFFYGRGGELAQLVALVQRATVTLLYGLSGLGKSSLINAGLFFKLREEPREYFPIPVTLRFSTVPSQENLALDYLVQRVKDDISTALAAGKIDARPPAPNETLYEYFHREDIDFWDKQNRPLTAVLVFDQFEELFTLGASDDLARNRTEYFLEEFAALAEGVHTDPVRRHFEENPGAKAACDFDKRSFKIVLCIREDFLPHLADREELFPSVLRQSMRLEEMSPDQALEVVEKPGGHLVAPGVAEQIVDFVSGSWSSETGNGDHTHRAAKRRVDPSILSLVCQQLNDQRKAQQKQSGKPEVIGAAQLAEGGAERIIEHYYRKSVDDFPALRSFIEHGLVTWEGHRCALPEHDALAKGVRQQDVNFLVRNRRILLREVEDGVNWLRLSHDRLAAVARQSRDEREIEKQRLFEEHRRKEAELKQLEAEEKQREAEARERETEGLRKQAVEAEERMAKALSRSRFFLILAIFGLGVAVFYAFKSAWSERLAKARFEAEKLIGFMIFDLRDKLEPVGRLDLLDAVYGHVRAYYDAFGDEQESPEILRQRGVLLDNLGSLLGAQGNLDGALKSYHDELKIIQKLTKQDSTKPEWQEDLERSYLNLGDVLREQGDWNGALNSYHASLLILQKLAKEDPGNTRWQRSLSNSNERLGDALRDRGDLAGALNRYLDSQAIREELAKQNPSNAGLHSDVSISYEKVGDILREQGDLTGAFNRYRDSQRIREELAKQEPGNVGWRRNLSNSYERLGDILRDQGDWSGAFNKYRDSQAIREELANQYPGNAGLRSDLSNSYERLGDVLRDQGDWADASNKYRDSQAIREKLAKQDPSNAGLQSDLAISDERLGDVLSDQGDWAGALNMYRESLVKRQKLAKQDPDNARWQGNLAFMYFRTGTTLARAAPESKIEAREMVLKAQDILRKLKERTGLTAQQKNWLDLIESALPDRRDEAGP